VRAITSKPVCVGFGIVDAASACAVAAVAEGVIVGSALVARIGDRNAVEAARGFISELRRGTDLRPCQY